MTFPVIDMMNLESVFGNPQLAGRIPQCCWELLAGRIR